MKYVKIIKNILKKNNLSQNELALVIWVNQTTVSQWLLGKKHHSYDSILMFYEKFEVTSNVFWGIEEDFD